VHNASVRKAFASIARSQRIAFTIASSLFAIVALAACGSRDGTAPLVPAAIVITTPSGTTSVTGTIQFSATVTDADGHTIAVTPTWSVVNGGGTITSDGLFTAGDSIGTFVNTVVATSGTATSSSTVIVSAGALASITVTPDSVNLAIGAAQQYAAVGKDAQGHVVDIPNRVWSVAAGGGTIDTAGMLTAGTMAGTFAHTVTATSGSISGTVSVTVLAGPLESITVTPPSISLAIGGQQTFTATGYDAYDNVVAITPTWLVVSSGGTIDGGGVFTAGTVAGTFTNTVMARQGSGCGSIAGRASVTILPGALTTVTVSPSNPSVDEGATQQYAAVGTDTHGNVVAITPVWAMVGAGGGTIDASSGLFTAGSTAATFTNTVRATASSISGTASVTVTAPVGPLVTIVVTPGNPTLIGPNSQQFTATGYDASLNVVPIPGTLVWGLNTSWSIGSIDASGLYQYNGTYDGSISDAISVTNGPVVGYASLTLNCGC
jgi:hypothetical protein